MLQNTNQLQRQTKKFTYYREIETTSNHLTNETMVSYANVSCCDILSSALSRTGGGIVSRSAFVCRIITYYTMCWAHAGVREKKSSSDTWGTKYASKCINIISLKKKQKERKNIRSIRSTLKHEVYFSTTCCLYTSCNFEKEGEMKAMIWRCFLSTHACLGSVKRFEVRKAECGPSFEELSSWRTVPRIAVSVNVCVLPVYSPWMVRGRFCASKNGHKTKKKKEGEYESKRTYVQGRRGGHEERR